jgi:hypothetical protein
MTIPFSLISTALNSVSPEPAAPEVQETGNSDMFSIGGQSVANGSGNSFSITKYPRDVGSAEVPHYVIFYVNVRQSDISKEEHPASTKLVNLDRSGANRPPTEAAAISAMIRGTTLLGGAIFGTKLGKFAGKIIDDLDPARAVPIIGNAFNKRFEIFSGAAGGLAGVAIGNSVGSMIGPYLGAERTQVLLKDAIALYVSGKPTANYHASWEEEDLGIAAQLGNAFSSGNPKDAAGNMMKTIAEGGVGMTMWATLKGADKAKNDIVGNLGGALESSAGITPNPFKAQLFKSMGFRKFKFTYSFLPRDITEYRDIQKIIKTFKKYMHPKLGVGKFIMNYPAEFSISYFYKDQRNNELFKISNCALTNMKVEYGGTDFITFKDVPGGPTEITMVLDFLELEMLTQDRIAADF